MVRVHRPAAAASFLLAPALLFSLSFSLIPRVLLFPRRVYEADPAMLKLALEAPIPPSLTRTSGRLASGSIFIDGPAKKAMASSVWEPLGWPLAAEMENAGVAQICKAYDTPYVSLRALSDLIEGDANEDFGKFCQQAADNVFPIVQYIAKNYP